VAGEKKSRASSDKEKDSLIEPVGPWSSTAGAFMWPVTDFRSEFCFFVKEAELAGLMEIGSSEMI
jgi:uncharacterized cupin superfamily protein